MTRVLLLRHAETAAPDRFHGAESDIGLGPNGRLQAERAALALARLGPWSLASSAMRRAVETAEILASAAGLSFERVAELHERRMPGLSGRSKQDGAMALYESEKASWMAGDLHAAHDGAESFADVRDRVVPAFLSLAERHRGGTLVVVAHGLVNRVLLTCLVDSLGPADFDRLGMGFVAANDLRFDGQAWRVEAISRPCDELAVWRGMDAL